MPYANFPNGHVINLLKDNPDLFENIELGVFLERLPTIQQAAFVNSELFLHSSLYQENSMTSLIMLLSAIERAVSPDHRPLESQLVSSDFKAKIEAAKDGKGANAILQKQVSSHLNSYSSRKTIAGFFCDNLSNEQKLQLIWGIKLAHKYKKSTPPPGITKPGRYGELVAIYTPITEPNPVLQPDDTSAIDEELSKRIKAFIFDIRNGFVHRAQANPFGNEDYMKKNIMYTHEKYENGEPKETWLITMTFKQLHSLAHIAFQNFWIKEYQRIKTE